MTQFRLQGRPFITLNNLLKVEGLVESGGVAKQVISEGLVKVDEQVELRKRCKIIAGQKIEFGGARVKIID